jgi:hypothetical protein
MLVTPSLYAAWRWYISRDQEDDGQARDDLITYLKREEIKPGEDVLKGRAFEHDIKARAAGVAGAFDSPLYENAVAEIAEIVAGGLWQERIYLDLNFRQHGSFLLYGKIDVLKGPWCHDIKWRRKGSTYQVGQYAKGIQHTAYMAGTRCPKFAFHISDGKSVWRENYFYTETLFEEMRGRLLDMLDDIHRDPVLRKLYLEHWEADRARSASAAA